MKAFILIALKEDVEKELLESIKAYPEVGDAHILFGEWDMIAEVDVANAEELGTFVMDKLRKKDAVRLTSCLIVAGK